MPVAPCSLDPSSLMPWVIPPHLDAPLDAVQALYTTVVDRLRANPDLAPYEYVLPAEEFSAAQYAWLAIALAALQLDLGEALAAAL